MDLHDKSSYAECMDIKLAQNILEQISDNPIATESECKDHDHDDSDKDPPFEALIPHYVSPPSHCSVFYCREGCFKSDGKI